MNSRIFFDLDGVLAEFRYASPYEDLYRRGYFETLRPNENIVQAAKALVRDPLTEVYILSAVLMDSEYALSEKVLWCNRYLPEIPPGHRIFIPCSASTDKSRYIGKLRETDVLVDDYGVNLDRWTARKVKVARDETDRMKEMSRFDHVISPYMDPSDIQREIKNA